MADPAEILKRRKAMALRIAQELERKWPNLFAEGYDVEVAAAIIDAMIPLTNVEAEAEYDEAIPEDDI